MNSIPFTLWGKRIMHTVFLAAMCLCVTSPVADVSKETAADALPFTIQLFTGEKYTSYINLPGHHLIKEVNK